MPGVPCPPVGRLGRASPPAPGRCSAQTASLPLLGHCACRSPPTTLSASVRSWCPLQARDRGEAPPTTPGPLVVRSPIRKCDKETSGAPKCPSSPSADMPRSQTPGVSSILALAYSGLLPAGHWKPSAFPSVPPGGLSCGPRRDALRGAITRPAASFHPAPYAPCWGCTWMSLLTCWLGFDQVGLALALSPTE
jgi:hypothetical protein